MSLNGKCIMCRLEGVEGARLYTDSERYVLCAGCSKDWVYYRHGGYIHSRRASSVRWKHQDALRRNVASILSSHGICGVSYDTILSEIAFPEWGIGVRGGLLRFDLGVPKLNLLVDYHGRQHYGEKGPYGGNYRIQRKNDELKVKLCREHGYKYMVFSYKEEKEVFGKEYVERRLKRALPALREGKVRTRSRGKGRGRKVSTTLVAPKARVKGVK